MRVKDLKFIPKSLNPYKFNEFIIVDLKSPSLNPSIQIDPLLSFDIKHFGEVALLSSTT